MSFLSQSLGRIKPSPTIAVATKSGYPVPACLPQADCGCDGHVVALHEAVDRDCGQDVGGLDQVGKAAAIGSLDQFLFETGQFPPPF